MPIDEFRKGTVVVCLSKKKAQTLRAALEQTQDKTLKAVDLSVRTAIEIAY